MSKFKSGDVVKNLETGAIHLYITDTKFIHIVTPTGDTLHRTWDTSVYPMIFGPKGINSLHELIFNLGQGIAEYLGYKNLEHKERKNDFPYK